MLDYRIINDINLMNKLDYNTFKQLLKTARNQLVAKTDKGIFFITVSGFTSFNERGYVARQEGTGKFEVLLYEDILELTIDGKIFNFSR